jgi:purine-binding chemotaxis protein CheW
MDHDDSRQILHERAVALAREYADEECKGEQIDITVFHLGNERYAFESHLIREVVACGGYTPLPCVPPFIAGIMSLRGRILALIDLQRLLELPGDRVNENCTVFVLSHDGMEFGVIASDIEGNMRITSSSLREDFPALDWVGGKYLRGVTSERLAVLDGLKLLHDPALVVNEEIN